MQVVQEATPAQKRFRRRWSAIAMLAGGVAALVLAGPRPTGAARAPRVTEFTEGFTGHPAGMVLGPDRNFWFTEEYDQQIGTFNIRTQTATEFDVPPGTFPHGITVGPDRNIWFAGYADVIGKFDLSTRAVTLFRQGITPGSIPHVIVSAPDGNLYFSEQGTGEIPTPDPLARMCEGASGRIAQFNMANQQITEYTDGLPADNCLHGITVGPDGNIWAAIHSADRIARFNLQTKKFDLFVSFSPGSHPIDLITGPDRRIYVTLQGSNSLGQFDLRTLQAREFTTSLGPQDGPSVDTLTIGPDRRSIWFSMFLHDRVARFDIKKQRITEYSEGITPASGPLGIASGPDRNLWFTEVNFNPTQPGRIARLRGR
jgi:streptogramin lyase